MRPALPSRALEVLSRALRVPGQGLTTGQNVSNTGQNLINAGLTTQTNAASALAGGSQSALSSIGNAQAAGTLGQANALSSGIGGLSNAALLYGLGAAWPRGQRRQHLRRRFLRVAGTLP